MISSNSFDSIVSEQEIDVPSLDIDMNIGAVNILGVMPEEKVPMFSTEYSSVVIDKALQNRFKVNNGRSAQEIDVPSSNIDTDIGAANILGVIPAEKVPMFSTEHSSVVIHKLLQNHLKVNVGSSKKNLKSSKRIDAQSETQTSIYSSPFYSSSTGYKMRARLYLNGDGNARRTHMSFFFVLMRSVNDPILQFPFNYKVTFCLYDQTPAQRHIIDSFRPDIRSSSFQRPRSDMNIASGIPKFFPLEVIQQEGNPYVRNDTMFIKVMVDFGDIPKTLLPFALSLNSGLRTHIQQMIIKQEAKRRSQQQSDEQPHIPPN
ncbi:unnamed protein product [Rotaria sp. Silwood2]|nr:unnamed protein product [Rotaria sp. Silwood2]